MCESKADTSKEQVRPVVGQVDLIQAPAVPQNPRNTGTNYMSFWWTSCLTVFLTSIIIAWIPNLLSPDPPKGNVEGYVSLKFKKVEDIFRLNLLSSEEKGAAFAVFKDGSAVVDIWGGYSDIQAWQSWSNSTLTNTFSLNNIIISLSFALLYERGLIDFDVPVGHYWPEFANNGKEKITVRMLLSEQRLLWSSIVFTQGWQIIVYMYYNLLKWNNEGIPFEGKVEIEGNTHYLYHPPCLHFPQMAGLGKFNRSISIQNITNQTYIEQLLASQTPHFPVFLRSGPDQGILELYADQLIQKIDPAKRSLKSFFEEEFISKYELDYYIGLPLAQQYRAARVRGHGFSIVFEVLFAPIELLCTLMSYMRSNTFTEVNSINRFNDPEIRMSSIGAVSSFSSARALAQLYRDALLVNGANGKPLISSETWGRMSAPYTISTVHSLAMKIGVLSNYSFSAAGYVRPMQKDSVMVGYSALGGQYVYVDVKNNLSLSYLTNYYSTYTLELDPRFKSLLRAVYDNI